MKLTFLVGILSLGAAEAKFSENVDHVIAAIQDLDNSILGWNRGKGIEGAVVIQQKYVPLSNAVANLDSSFSSANKGEVQSPTFNRLANSLASLLNHLASKAADIKSVGAGMIVANDIRGLMGQARDIENKAIHIAKDCSFRPILIKDLGLINQAFTRVGNSYDIPVDGLPTARPC